MSEKFLPGAPESRNQFVINRTPKLIDQLDSLGRTVVGIADGDMQPITLRFNHFVLDNSPVINDDVESIWNVWTKIYWNIKGKVETVAYRICFAVNKEKEEKQKINKNVKFFILQLVKFFPCALTM